MYFHSIVLSALLLVAGAAGRNLRGVDVDESRVQELRSKLNLLEEMVASKKETEKENLFEDIQERKNRLKIEQNEKQENFDALEAREGRVNELRNKVNSMKKRLESRIKNEDEDRLSIQLTDNIRNRIAMFFWSDFDQDGYITRREIMEAFDDDDSDRDGRISLEEFMHSPNNERILDPSKMFHALDTDQDGYITRKEFIDAFDIDYRDGRISRDEFVHA
eukprot:CAMPEP_0194171228 /NCGR_PEP_ID=MMETSP0154-20130528/5820_1 /TAXON_ID=1049557 /ORGANISM="Thalassiothrix antarctica, Strain L6-D1" /LENGTH=219 /DNA_ID=CAMNT_0038883429 /DNA_START=166 /DNA_END=825 /DNA_ORIENTATION=+